MAKRKNNDKGKTIAVVSDGSAVFGLGNIGGKTALPIMEGKAAQLAELGGFSAVAICLDTQDTEEIISTLKNIAPSFGGISLEGIAVPKCFEIERRLKDELDIPVFHDDRHGAAACISAAAINASKVMSKPLKNLRVVICGAGAAGNAAAKMLSALGVLDIIVCDSKGILCVTRLAEFGEGKLELLEFTNKDGLTGGLEEAVKGRDLFVGVSRPDVLTADMVRSMADEPVIFAIAEPEPEIKPDVARLAGARIICTSQINSQNRIDNSLISPGIIKGALEAGAEDITEPMKIAAAFALAEMIPDEELAETLILPAYGKSGVVVAIAKAVKAACEDTIRES